MYNTSFTQKRASLYPVSGFVIRLPRPVVRKRFCSTSQSNPSLCFSLPVISSTPLVTRRPFSLGTCEKTSVSFGLICNSPRHPSCNWTIYVTGPYAKFCFFHVLFATPNQVSLSMDWPSSLRWNSNGSVQFVAVPIFSQGQRGADESLMLETAVRPQEFVLLFVYALLIIIGI